MYREPPKKADNRYTIKSLRLDLQSAIDGKTWLLLPEGFRDQGSGQDYPLPSRRLELQKLVAIYLPPRKKDCGCLYIKRAIKEWKSRQQRAGSVLTDFARRETSIKRKEENFDQFVKGMRQQTRDAIDDVRKEAALAVASLHDLFALGRQGINAQMKAHLEGQEWQGEIIKARDFRECFRIVTQAVKGLGLPTDQKTAATDAIIEEVAASIKATQETVSMAPGTDTTN